MTKEVVYPLEGEEVEGAVSVRRHYGEGEFAYSASVCITASSNRGLAVGHAYGPTPQASAKNALTKALAHHKRQEVWARRRLRLTLEAGRVVHGLEADEKLWAQIQKIR